MSRKILGLTSVVLSLMMIFASVYTIFSQFNRNVKVSEGLETRGFAAEGDDKYNHSFDDKADVTTTNANYKKPDITLDDVVKELCMYGHVRDWDTGGAGYGDVWAGSGKTIAEKSKESTYINPSDVSQLDCGEFIYAGLRHLDVRFTGFYDGLSNGKDGRLGPIPITPNGYVRYVDSKNPDRKPYHIKWENGNEITRITDYTVRSVYNEETDKLEIVCGYGKWIDDNAIAPGTIVASPAAEAGDSGHVWLYIGKYNSKDEIINYLKGLGIAVEGVDGNTTGVRVLDEPEDGDSGTHWSIECRGSSHGNGEGVAITNRDPAGKSGDKLGSGYVGFTFLEEKVINGSFKLDLVKYNKEGEKLGGAEFEVDVKDGEESIYLDTKTTSSEEASLGTATFSDIPIKDEGKKYKVTVTETTAPAGYIGIDPPITFDVTTQKVGDEYKLVPAGDITSKVKNAKKVEVKEGEILIEAENRTTSIDIHKGVKTVENQDSGYYSVAKAIEEALEEQEKEDANIEPTYEDETTGKEYTEVELEDLQHEWVVETTIPEGISNYKRYLVTDPVDTTKLDFSGLDRVKVELIDSTGKVTKTLVKDTDYQTKYENDVLTVTYIDKKDGNDFYGEFLSTATTSDKIRLTFNTTFKVNPETGKLVVLEGTITNADNKAKLTYDNGSGTDQNKDSENPEVHTGAVSIFKYEDTNGNGKHDEDEPALVGAEFKIALSEEDAKNGKFVKIGGEELVAISNEDGIATFVGLSFGGDAKDDEENLKNGLYGYDWETASRDYYIVETKTPAGYEKITDVLKVTVSKDSSEKIDITDKIDELDSIGNKPLTFDLALRKWVTHAFVTENGQTVEYKTGHKAEDDPEAVVKVDLKKSKLSDVTVKFKYSIRITNEGEIAGEAREITDYIPAGLKFVQEDNPDWTTTSDERIVKTRKLEGVTLQPGESAEVEIMLTWVNSKDSMGVMTNTAEISEDYNEYGVHDIDSTPNNKKAGEDDIDDAPVMLAIKTGSEVVAYASLGLGFVTVVTMGAIVIRRKFVNM